MNKDTQLIWEAFLGETYFDSWKLPEGCEDWRLKYKNEVGLMQFGPAEVRDLMMKDCKPMATLDTDLHSAIISELQQKGLYVEPVEKGLTFIGRDPEWVKKGIEAWRAQDHVEYGKALGFGEHSYDIKEPETHARNVKFMKKKQDKERAEYDYWNSLAGTGEEPPEL